MVQTEFESVSNQTSPTLQREALAKSQAVTQPAANDDSNPPTSDSDSQHLNQAVPGPSTTATQSGDEDNDGLFRDVEVMEIGAFSKVLGARGDKGCHYTCTREGKIFYLPCTTCY